MRKVRNTAVLAKIETAYGTDAAPTGAADAILVTEASFNVTYNNVNRDLLRGYLGGSEQLAGTRWAEISFSVELAGSGTAGTAPAWGRLLRACAFAETVTADDRVEYNPISTSFESLTIDYFIDGVRRKALGCRGNVNITMNEGERPMLRFEFVGLDAGASAQTTPTLTLTSWRQPVVVTDVNTGDIRLGGTYTAGALSGGTVYPSRGLTLNVGNNVARIALLGNQSVDITNRDTTGQMQLELTAAQEVTLLSEVNSNTLRSLGLDHGTAAGHRITVWAPNVQLINPQYQDYEGRSHTSFDVRVLPSSGNDELRIVAR